MGFFFFSPFFCICLLACYIIKLDRENFPFIYFFSFPFLSKNFVSFRCFLENPETERNTDKCVLRLKRIRYDFFRQFRIDV